MASWYTLFDAQIHNMSGWIGATAAVVAAVVVTAAVVAAVVVTAAVVAALVLVVVFVVVAARG